MADDESRSMFAAVDARARLAGSNKMELLVFSLGTRETFGINVFKVREIMPAPPITWSPNLPAGLDGVVNLRGNIVPVINLARFAGGDAGASAREYLIVTEFSRRAQGFLVHDVSHIARVDWNRVKTPNPALTAAGAPVTALTELEPGRLVSILDVEQIISTVFGEPAVPEIAPVTQARLVFFADDSLVARKEIGHVLDRMQVPYQYATNGLEAWNTLQALAARADLEGASLAQRLGLVLTDAEMPEMDGYVLAKQIKSDHRFDGVPVVMHSSLSSAANHAMGRSVGVDAYVAKFEPMVLADTLRPLLAPRAA